MVPVGFGARRKSGERPRVAHSEGQRRGNGRALGNWEDVALEPNWGRWVEAQKSALMPGKLPLCPHLMNILHSHSSFLQAKLVPGT